MYLEKRNAFESMDEHYMRTRAIVASDESTSGHYVTAGSVYIPPQNIHFVLSALARVKQIHGIEDDAEVHCRILFAPDARRKGKFKILPPDKIGTFVLRIVQETSIAGCQWFGAKCNADEYPKRLNFSFAGKAKPFDVSYKHIAGLLMFANHTAIEQQRNGDYDLIYDKDATKLDWGLAQRMQATHFARISDKSIEVTTNTAPLLELADIAAYALGRALSAVEQPDNRKIQKFVAIQRAMNMILTTFQFAGGDVNPALSTA